MRRLILLTILSTLILVNTFAQNVSTGEARAQMVTKGARVDTMLADYQNLMDSMLTDGTNAAKLQKYNADLDAIMREANRWRLQFFNNHGRPGETSRADCAKYHEAEWKKYQALRKERDDWLATL
jgi:hypothetical protein